MPLLPALFALFALVAAHVHAAADRDKIEDFLTTTGFDVALDSIRLSAESAPVMLGLDAEAFGSQWTRMTAEVFDTEVMHDLAVDILAETLTEPLLTHASDFYASEFGQRIVAAENRSHLVEDDAAKSEAGELIVSGLVRIGSDRLADLRRMTNAVDSAGSAVRAIQEIQFRFLMAAASAGVIELRMDAGDLRGLLETQEGEMRLSIQSTALSGAAYTYQAFSDEEVAAYADALEHPDMQQVYALMNAVQYEVMANRFEALASEMAKLQPSTDL
jgi:hypothetical protein